MNMFASTAKALNQDKIANGGPTSRLGPKLIARSSERLRQNRCTSFLRALNHGSRQTIVGADPVQRYVEQVSGDATPAQSEFLT